MNLKKYGETLAYETAFWMLGFTSPDYPVEQMGKLSLELSEKFRALAIITMVVTDEADFFYHNLIRSGIMRKIYLQRLKNQGIDQDHHCTSGLYDALLDAIAANDFDLARRIVELSPKEWQQGHEYEDDYCYAQILHRFVQEIPPEQEIPPLLTQFETYTEGQPNARLDVCRALFEKNQTAFDDALDALLNEREAKIIADKERGQLEDPIVIANRLVFVEGLAILRFAERRGLKTQSEYRYCPSLARVPMTKPFPGE